jgi:hypothetical protein
MATVPINQYNPLATVSQLSAQRSNSSSDPQSQAPIPALQAIYNSNDFAHLSQVFGQNISYIESNLRLFSQAMEEMYSANDNFDLSNISNPANPTPLDKMKLAIRSAAACISRCAELNGSSGRLLSMESRLNDLLNSSNSWQAAKYFQPLINNALARNCPSILAEQINSQQISDPCSAALSLLRNGYSLPQSQIVQLCRNGGSDSIFALAQYIDDPTAKLDFLMTNFNQLQGRPYSERCWAQREIVNALASFPEGRTALNSLRTEGKIDFTVVHSVYFGALAGSGVSLGDINRNQDALSLAAGLIVQANQRFGGREQTLFVDITPNALAGQPLNPAGWGENSLYLTKDMLTENSSRAVAFVLLHETCEQRYVKGFFSTELGRTYLDALTKGRSQGAPLETLRLGTRIGGGYSNSGFGHPWDSEREWLAETASAVIIGEPLPNNASPALNAAQRLLGH